MDTKKFDELMTNIQNKLGKESSSKIADDIGTLITDNANMNNQISNKDKQIEQLKTDKENLITTNGNLLQQISMSEKDLGFPEDKNKNDEPKEPFSFRKQFDEKGNFLN